MEAAVEAGEEQRPGIEQGTIGRVGTSTPASFEHIGIEVTYNGELLHQYFFYIFVCIFYINFIYFIMLNFVVFPEQVLFFCFRLL